MNRRNFVVGLGTVATISGVASVTSATFYDSVQPTTNFQIVPDNAELTVRRLQSEVDYDSLSSGNDSWNDTEITDFGSITGDVGNPVVAYVNASEDGSLGAQLAFNNTNTTHNQYIYNSGDDTSQFGFFEIANLGETDEDVSITLGFDQTNVGADGVLTEGEVADMFTFLAEDGTPISPDSTDTTIPAGEVTITSGNIEIIGLEIHITEAVYDTIQDAAGGAFSPTEPSFQLLESITVGTDHSEVTN